MEKEEHFYKLLFNEIKHYVLCAKDEMEDLQDYRINFLELYNALEFYKNCDIKVPLTYADFNDCRFVLGWDIERGDNAKAFYAYFKNDSIKFHLIDFEQGGKLSDNYNDIPKREWLGNV